MILSILVYLALLLGACYYLFTRSYGYWKSRGVPFEKPVFPFGSLPQVFLRKEHIIDNLCRLYSKYKGHPYFGIYNFNKPTLVVTDPELLRLILVKDFDKFTDRNVRPSEDVDPVAYHSLFVSTGSVWKAIRAKITPVFTSGKMKLMYPLMQECAENLEVYMDKHNGQEIEAKTVMKKYTLDVISSCAFGINARVLQGEGQEMEDMASRLLDFKGILRNLAFFCFFFFPKLLTWLRLKVTDTIASDYLINVYKSVLKQRENEGVVRNDLIDHLNTMRKNETMADTYKFDEINMSAQAITFFTAGSDTTAITLSFALHELAMNTDIQERLRNEVTKVYNANGGFTYEAMQEMKYVDMVLNETLRRYPLAAILNRQANADYVIEDTGLVIEKNMDVLIPACALVSDPEYFPDPQRFDPERFNDANKAKIRPYTYLPFGDGPRNCIGQRFGLLVAKLALATAVKNFTFERSARTKRDVVFDPRSILMESIDGLHLKVTRI